MKLQKVSKFIEERLMEELASTEHERWSSWQQYLFDTGKCNSDGSVTLRWEDVEHWKKLIETPYKDLPEHSKQSDRDQVMKYINCIRGSDLDLEVIVTK